MDKSILKKLSYGVYIISTKDNNKLFGCIANSVMQINSNTIAISLNKNNDTTKAILNTKKLAINILDINTDIDIINTFGFKKSLEYNKYESINYTLDDNIPIISNTCGYIIGNVYNVVDVDSHIIVLINIEKMINNSLEEVMTYNYYQTELKGKTNKSAPTYQEDKITSNKHVFVCKICGYRYETDLEELPDDFKCPMCGVGKEYFEKLQ